MRNETSFSDVSYKNIKVLLASIDQTQDKTFERISSLYGGKVPNVKRALRLADDLRLVRIRDGRVTKTKNFELVLNGSLAKQAESKAALVSLVFNSKRECKKQVQGYLSNFQYDVQGYRYQPTISESVKYKGVRNFLVELGLVTYDRGTKVYTIAPLHLSRFIELQEVQYMAPDELKYVLKKKAELGIAAEKEIIKYEEVRLVDFPDLVKKIEYTARKNVKAGYDIRSWEVDPGKKKGGRDTERYIEVKAVSIKGYSFYWTRNEIEKAEKYGKNYFLYLLPVVSNKKFNIEGLEIICDPYINVFPKKKQWKRQIESYQFSKRN